jgi:predicted HTH transcriptional regulator
MLVKLDKDRRMKPTKIIEVTDDIKQKVIKFIRRNGSITNRQCREFLGIGYDQAINLFNYMVKSGELIREGKTSSVKYRLPTKKSS